MTGSGETFEEQVRSVAVLADPVRRALYRYVASRHHEVGRDEAAAAAGVSRSLAAFHLDRLVEQGLLEAGYRRLSGRRGPGAGRPAKVYRRSDLELEVSIPARRYGFLARLLAVTLDELGDRGDVALAEAARRVGVEVGSTARRAEAGDGPAPDAVEGILVESGFEPARGEDGVVTLRNCPFDAVAREFTPLVCGANVSFLQGLLEGLGERRVTVVLDPADGRCCAVLRPSG